VERAGEDKRLTFMCRQMHSPSTRTRQSAASTSTRSTVQDHLHPPAAEKSAEALGEIISH